jgi:hypothetical protein
MWRGSSKDQGGGGVAVLRMFGMLKLLRRILL